MKLKLATILFIFLAATVYLVSCKKEPLPHHTVSQETLDYCVFQNGTRWIYEEKNTLVVDTFTVYEFEKIKMDFDDRNYTVDDYLYKLKSSILGYGINDFYDFRIFPEHKYAKGVDVCHSAGPYTQGLWPVEYFDAQDTGTVFQQYVMNPGMKYIAFYDTLELEGKLYHNVKVFEYIEPFENSYPQKIYWAKHIGRIRFELYNGGIWNLIEYTIKQ